LPENPSFIPEAGCGQSPRKVSFKMPLFLCKKIEQQLFEFIDGKPDDIADSAITNHKIS